jgi:hypothetical protein
MLWVLHERSPKGCKAILRHAPRLLPRLPCIHLATSWKKVTHLKAASEQIFFDAFRKYTPLAVYVQLSRASFWTIALMRQKCPACAEMTINHHAIMDIHVGLAHFKMGVDGRQSSFHLFLLESMHMNER